MSYEWRLFVHALLSHTQLADMATKLESARLLTHKAAQMKDAGQNYTKEVCNQLLFLLELVLVLVTC